MKKNYLACAIVWEPNNNFILLTKDKQNYKLPQLKIISGDDPIKTLKEKIINECIEEKIKNNLSIKFLRTLPDTWSRLVFMHSRYDQILRIYYIFNAFELIDKKESSIIKNLFLINKKSKESGWINFNDIDKSFIDTKDFLALKSFEKIYDFHLEDE